VESQLDQPNPHTRYILGVDAAWTESEPSGVALLGVKRGRKPQLIRVGRAYGEFSQWGRIDWDKRVDGAMPRMDALVGDCAGKGYPISVVALDIPLSPETITGRRTADNLISRRYGSRKASTHSPTEGRPGDVSAMIFTQLTLAGFSWAFSQLGEATFIEVYPHPAIIELFRLAERLPYKVSKHRSYWPNLSPSQSRRKVAEQLHWLHRSIGKMVSGTNKCIPALDVRKTRPLWRLKSYEDALDAVICGLVGTRYIAGDTTPFGDELSAIWVPNRNR